MASCPIWGVAAEEVVSGQGGTKYNSPRADGLFRITGTAMVTVENLTKSEKAKLTTWIVNQHLAGEPAPLVTDEQVQLAKQTRSLSFSQKSDRLLQLTQRLEWNFNDNIHVNGNPFTQCGMTYDNVMSNCELKEGDELFFFLIALTEAGYLRQSQHSFFHLTNQAYRRLDEIQSGGVNTHQVFVAMWFSDFMETAFNDGIAPAILAAGYVPMRIDKKEHNNKIDDEIIAEIRASKFIVSDFTSDFIGTGNDKRIESRGGVYYEAGFAHGLGKPVIFTTRSDCIDYIHFDTRQIAHIIWENPKDLKERLYNRIAATIGISRT